MKFARFNTGLALLIVLVFTATLQAYAAGPVVRIGMVADGYWERDAELVALLKAEILNLTEGEFDVRFPEDKFIYADYTVEGVRTKLDQLLEDPDVDIVIAGGAIASYEAATRGPLPKPVVAPFVIDAEIQGMPMKDGGSGVKNLNYVALPAPVRTDLEAFLQVVSFRRMVVLLNKYYAEAFRDAPDRVSEILDEFDLESTTIEVGKSADEALAQIPADAEAVYVVALTQLSSEEFDKLVAGLIDRRLPSFSEMGNYDVERGILAGLRVDIFPKILRRTALNIQRILLGEEPGSIPVAFASESQMTINMATARAIGVFPNWSVITYAVLLNAQTEDIEREVNLRGVVHEALLANRDLTAEQYSVAAGAQQVNQSRSRLLPQVDLSAMGMTIDEDRAAASFGQQSEHSASGSAAASQIIYSDGAWADWSIQKHTQKSREAEYEQLRLDIVQDAGTAYLNVLRAKAFARIQRENLRRTEKNLDVARVREAVGVAGPAEVYRWESEIATGRKTLIDAGAQTQVAEIELNRLLHRPLEEQFLTEEEDVHDPALIGEEAWYYRFTRNMLAVSTLLDFLVEEGLENSPELKAIDAAIAANERALKYTGRRFWLPDLGFQGEIGRTFWKDGEGSGASVLGVDDTDWSIAVGLTFPLIEGGDKLASRGRAARELDQLRIQRESVVERVAQRIRSTFIVASASYAGMEQTTLAAEAADKSLEVVSDAYSRGAVSILDLLDAQNAALVADLAAADAVYSFLVDRLASERAYGSFEILTTEEELQAFIGRIEAHFMERGVSVD
jgi:outer membrane protein TolC